MAEPADFQVTIPDAPPRVVPSVTLDHYDYTPEHGRMLLATLPAEQLLCAVPPWPVVSECYRHKDPTEACPQCAGTHEHRWRAWQNPPANHPAVSGPGTPVRCMDCGARKCDQDCTQRRHHRGDHTPW